MKKLIKTLLCIFLVCPLVGYFDSTEVYADQKYEVDYIDDDGDFEEIATYDNLKDAKNKMAENEDYVVRCESSLSPSKIVAMNSGLVYSYPKRKNSQTTNLYEKLTDDLYGTGTTICVSSNYEMTYHETYSTTYSSSKNYMMGWVKVTLNGFTGYIDLEYCDLVPTKFIKNGLPITLGGSPESSYDVICKQKYYTAETNGNYNDLVLHYYLGIPSEDGTSYGYTLRIGVAPSFMSSGTKYYSNDGINFYTNSELSNLAGTYYNYYQFVPLRTYSKISGSTLDSYLESKGFKSESSSVLYGHGDDFIEDQNKYGVNGTIIYAMAIFESGYGTSDIAKSKNNLFGWGAFDNNTSAATTYGSVSDCVKSQMADNLSNYLDESSNFYYWSMSLGNKGGGISLKYSSDPYWPEKLASCYYDIDKFANDKNGNLTDYNTETLALVTTVGANVYKSADANSEVWYTTQNKANNYQKNLIIVVLEKGDTFTKVRTSNNIDEDGLLKPISKPAGYIASYNASTSYGYIKNSDLQIINVSTSGVPEASKTETVDESKFSDYLEIDSLSISNSKLSIEGLAFFKGISFKESSTVSHKLIVTNTSTNETQTFDLTTSVIDPFQFNDGYTYEKIEFKGDIDLSKLGIGTYTLSVQTTNDKYTRTVKLVGASSKYSNIVDSVTNKYRITNNYRMSNRLELEVYSSPVSYSSIKKPSGRRSYLDIVNIGFDSEKAVLNLEADSFIYYLNYPNADSCQYKLYLIKDENSYTVYDCTNEKTPEGLIPSSYDLSYISFTSSSDLSALEKGTYRLVLSMKNGDYVEYIDLVSIASFAEKTKTINEVTYRLYKNSNNRITLEIK